MIFKDDSNQEEHRPLLNNMWTRHFNMLVALVVVLGLAVGAVAAAAFTKPAPAVIAQTAQAGTSGQAARQNSGNGSQQGATTQSGTNGGSRAVFGTVGSVDSTTLTVKGQQGDVKVTLAGARISKTVDGTAADLKAGERVTVTGQQESDGSYTATTVQIVAADQPQAGSGTAPAQAAGATRTPGQQGGGNRAQGQGQQAGASAVRLAGSVSAVDSGTLTLTTQQGDVKVKLGSAKIEKQAEAAASDLQAGQQVAVIGQPGADGTYATAQVQILPAGAASAPVPTPAR